jgi:predicted ATP-grasp superfamily ATP-dependent carboligase
MNQLQVTLPPVALFDNAYSSTLALLISLGEHGVPVNVYGSNAIGATRWSRYCTNYRRCPSVDEPSEFIPWLRDKLRCGEITRVAPTSDLMAFYIAELRDEFPLDVQTTIPTLNEIENCLIKSRFSLACAEHGIATPETAAPTTIDEAQLFADRVGYPLVMKAKSHLAVGMSERGAIIYSAQQLRQEFRPYDLMEGHAYIAERYPELRLPLLQKFIPSATTLVYSVSGFKDAERGIVAAALSYKSEQWPPKVGVSTHQVGCDDQQILQIGRDAVDRLLGCGIFELELLVDGDDLLAIDLNPRCFGFMLLDMARGSDLPWLWFQSTLGNRSVEQQPATLPALEGRQALPYYVSRLVGLLTGPDRRAKFLQFCCELRTPWVSMTGQWRDPVPKLAGLFAMLRHPGSLIRPYWRMRHENRLINATNTSIRDQSSQAPAPKQKPRFNNLGTATANQAANTFSDAMATLEHLATGAHPRMVFTVRQTTGSTPAKPRPSATGNRHPE